MARTTDIAAARCPRCGDESDREPCIRCRDDPFPEDTEIRRARGRHGVQRFQIACRDGNRAAIWWDRQTEEFYYHAEALRIVRRDAE